MLRPPSVLSLMKVAMDMGWLVFGYENICSDSEYRGWGEWGSRGLEGLRGLKSVLEEIEVEVLRPRSLNPRRTCDTIH